VEISVLLSQECLRIEDQLPLLAPQAEVELVQCPKTDVMGRAWVSWRADHKTPCVEVFLQAAWLLHLRMYLVKEGHTKDTDKLRNDWDLLWGADHRLAQDTVLDNPLLLLWVELAEDEGKQPWLSLGSISTPAITLWLALITAILEGMRHVIDVTQGLRRDGIYSVTLHTKFCRSSLANMVTART